ncbi:methyltransferase [Saccharothrix australiensis]|uniref:Methyltransferase family protein n=1 Tax=Saccharothrix australiensis TaxID=2072 RepID=A0A495W1T6_9PSEU|nr:methyltransferase [Saccharothrix australiensis]RKT55622.1 methyltransferase family protein [Saccharothrix australiensis]
MALVEVSGGVDAPTTAVELFELITAHHTSSAIFVAAQLGVADHLAAGPRDATGLARETGTDAPSLRRLLRLLVSSGVLAEPEAGVFALTELGQLLRTDHEDSMNAVALMMANPRHQQRWGQLGDVVRTGRSAVEEEHLDDPFKQLPPHIVKLVGQVMTFFVSHSAESVAKSYDFSRFGTLVEVGGGEGIMLSTILAEYPRLRGVLFDTPYMAHRAKRRIAGEPVADRCEVVGGDFFQSVPGGGDAYLLNNVIHDWDDRRGVEILSNVHAAMRPGGKLLIVETLYPDRFDDSLASKIAARSDVNMMVNMAARERGADDFEQLVDKAGFTLDRVLRIRPAWSGIRSSSIVEATHR